MKIAIKHNSIFKEEDYKDRFKEIELIKEPYSYQIIEVDKEDVVFEDFDFIDNKYIFNDDKHKERVSKNASNIFINEMERQYLNEMFISYAKSKKTKDIKDTEYLKIKENING